MRFPITDLLDQTDCERWLLEHFHPDGLRCPQCQTPVHDAHRFRRTKKSQLQVYRCNQCQCVYNLYTNTVFQQRHLTPQQVVLLVRGVLKGDTSAEIADELGVSYQTVLDIRRDLQANAAQLQPDTPLPDQVTESDELFVNAGEKRRGAP
jgi:transposase-like protein